jgi:inosine/xanthosine triphosphate pyrophosphatase family protein
VTTRLLLATTNPAKLSRLRDLLRGLDTLVELVTPAEIGIRAADDLEGERSLADNAVRKAQAWAAAAHLPAIATDGGLSVPALPRRSWRAVRTRRAAGESASPAEHAQHLLRLTAHLAGDARRAYQLEAIALVAADGRLIGVWTARGPRRLIGPTYLPDAADPGFWVPGVLLPVGSVAAEAHWQRLRRPLCSAVRALSVGESNAELTVDLVVAEQAV